MEHGHGEHWEAIEGDTKKTVTTLLPVSIERGKVTGGSEFNVILEDGTVRREKALGIVHGEMPLRYLVLVCTDSTKGQPVNTVWSFYPLCAECVSHRLTIEKLHPWENGIEGVVSASTTSGAMVWFFDPYYFVNKDVYKIGKGYDITLGALALKLQKPAQNEIVITEGPLIELERQRAIEEDPHADTSKITSVTLSLENLSMCMPSEDYPDEASYRGVVENIGYFETEGIGFYRYKTTILKFGDDNLVSIYLYASESVLGDYRPKVGDNVEGVIWMQGTIGASVPAAKSPRRRNASR